MPLQPCLIGKNHRWTSGPWKTCKCIKCGRKYLDLKQPAKKLSPKQLLDSLKKAEQETKELERQRRVELLCTCCPVHKARF